jgi:hypothetical protein
MLAASFRAGSGEPQDAESAEGKARRRRARGRKAAHRGRANVLGQVSDGQTTQNALKNIANLPKDDKVFALGGGLSAGVQRTLRSGEPVPRGAAPQPLTRAEQPPPVLMKELF